MALSLSVAFQNAIANPSGSAVVFLTFEFGTGTYGFWTGVGPITYNGLLYNAGGSVFDVDDIQQNSDGSVSELTLTLSAAPSNGIGTDVLVALYAEDWHLRPVTIQLGMLDVGTGAVIDAQTFFRGTMDTAPHEEGRKTDAIKARCLSRSSVLTESGNLYRNNATQVRMDAADTSMKDIGTLNGSLNKEVKWNQAT